MNSWHRHEFMQQLLVWGKFNSRVGQLAEIRRRNLLSNHDRRSTLKSWSLYIQRKDKLNYCVIHMVNDNTKTLAARGVEIPNDTSVGC